MEDLVHHKFTKRKKGIIYIYWFRLFVTIITICIVVWIKYYRLFNIKHKISYLIYKHKISTEVYHVEKNYHWLVTWSLGHGIGYILCKWRQRDEVRGFSLLNTSTLVSGNLIISLVSKVIQKLCLIFLIHSWPFFFYINVSAINFTFVSIFSFYNISFASSDLISMFHSFSKLMTSFRRLTEKFLSFLMQLSCFFFSWLFFQNKIDCLNCWSKIFFFFFEAKSLNIFLQLFRQSIRNDRRYHDIFWNLGCSGEIIWRTF